MSALAQFHAMGGETVTGSDRLLDQGGLDELKGAFEKLGIRLFSQDGSGVGSGTRQLTVSTAIEGNNPDIKKARELLIPVKHRTDVLAANVTAHRTLAVAGTSGKSTVTAMIFEILEAAGRSPSLITGAPLASLAERGLLGNALRGESDLLVIEADESDGTLPKYSPWLGILLNIGKDHKELSEIRELFARFRERSRSFVANADAAGLSEFLEGAATFGFEAGELRGTKLEIDARSCRFEVCGVSFELPAPGRYNAENALAAAAACRKAGVPLQTSAEALSRFRGISRRFEVVGAAGGVEVVDDYAHNPDKLRAVLSVARSRSKRAWVVFQSHGFYPTRFLKNELIDAFSDSLRPVDKLVMPDIYYVGGTTAKDISPEHIAAPVRERGLDARHIPKREDIAAEIAAAAGPGDMVLVLGARDPTLSAFARDILERLKAR